MPYLRIETNSPIAGDALTVLAKTLSAIVAEQLGKPESFVQVSLIRPDSLIFGGESDICAFAELRSLGLKPDQIPSLTNSITSELNAVLGVDATRLFINFFDHPRSHWSWNGKPFA